MKYFGLIRQTVSLIIHTRREYWLDKMNHEGLTWSNQSQLGVNSKLSKITTFCIQVDKAKEVKVSLCSKNIDFPKRLLIFFLYLLVFQVKQNKTTNTAICMNNILKIISIHSFFSMYTTIQSIVIDGLSDTFRKKRFCNYSLNRAVAF